MKYFVRLATEQDKPAVAKFYDNSLPLIDEKQTSWIKNIYPSIDTALKAIDLSQLFVCYDSNDIVSGTVILNNQSDKEYENITWSTPELDPNQILVIHTLIIDPKKLNQGIASAMINFIKEFGKSNSMVTIRLDTNFKNTPAQKLYEKHQFVFRGRTNLKSFDNKGWDDCVFYEFCLK